MNKNLCNNKTLHSTSETLYTTNMTACPLKLYFSTFLSGKTNFTDTNIHLMTLVT